MSEEARTEASAGDLLRMTADIVSAYVSRNQLPAVRIQEVIRAVHGSLDAVQRPLNRAPEPAPKPAVPIRRSVTPDYIVCLEDGKKLKMLKRYLRTNFNMTPEEYRAKWGLRSDYPMVAPSYAEQRSAFAKKIGLGRKGRRAAKTARKPK